MSVELPVATRHHRDMTEKLLKVTFLSGARTVIGVLVSLVVGSTTLSLGTRLWMPVLGYVESNLHLSLYLFYLFILIISFLISCDKLVHAEFMLYI